MNWTSLALDLSLTWEDHIKGLKEDEENAIYQRQIEAGRCDNGLRCNQSERTSDYPGDVLEDSSAFLEFQRCVHYRFGIRFPCLLCLFGQYDRSERFRQGKQRHKADRCEYEAEPKRPLPTEMRQTTSRNGLLGFSQLRCFDGLAALTPTESEATADKRSAGVGLNVILVGNAIPTRYHATAQPRWIGLLKTSA